jgi:hypothetical protein
MQTTVDVGVPERAAVEPAIPLCADRRLHRQFRQYEFVDRGLGAREAGVYGRMAYPFPLSPKTYCCEAVDLLFASLALALANSLSRSSRRIVAILSFCVSIVAMTCALSSPSRTR